MDAEGNKLNRVVEKVDDTCDGRREFITLIA